VRKGRGVFVGKRILVTMIGRLLALGEWEKKGGSLREGKSNANQRMQKGGKKKGHRKKAS